MTRAELLDVIYRFHPRGLHEGSLGYDDTEEAAHFRDAMRRGVAAYPTWRALFDRLRPQYPLRNHSLSFQRGDWDPAYSGEIYLPGDRSLYFHVSLLGPYYGIHRTGLPVEELPAVDSAREIDATFPGYAPIPPELGDLVVPDVAPGNLLFGEATIYECLLSELWALPLPPKHAVPVEGGGEAAWARLLDRSRAGLPVLLPAGVERHGEAVERHEGEPLDDDDPDDAGLP